MKVVMDLQTCQPASCCSGTSRYSIDHEAEEHSKLIEKQGLNPPRILVDVSCVARYDHQTGIQRVVKNIAAELYKKSQNYYRSIPVQLHNNKLLECKSILQKSTLSRIRKYEPEVRFERYDILVMLDSSWSFYDHFSEAFAQIREQKGGIYTVVYDLIPILYPYLTSCKTSAVFPKWLYSAIQNSDGLICISKAVADELITYIEEKQIPYNNNLKIGYFHLGADIKAVSPESFVRSQVREWFNHNGSNTFLIVGWIDPRKGQDFALDVFEKVWNTGIDVRLIFAGKESWNRREFIQRVLAHPEYSKKLLWIDKPTDADILHCYRHATALLFPSIAEGFGIPLIEAAEHGLPIICSDIPVFREIAGEYATYFARENPQHLEDIIRTWPNAKASLDSKNMPRLTWEQSADRLIDVILFNNWYKVLYL